jgi:chemotaxis protein histidine kinase CheA
MTRLLLALAVGVCFLAPGRALAASDADNLREGCNWLERAMAREPARDDAFGMFMRGMKPKCQALLEGLARKDGSVRPDALKQVTKEINDLREIIDAEAGGPPPPLKEPSADEQVRQKVQAEKEAADKAAADKAAADKAEADRIAKEKQAAREAEAQEAARKAAADKAEQEARQLAEREARAQTTAEKREAAEARKKAEREAAEARKQAEREAKERAAAEKKAAEEARKQAEREAKERAAAERDAARRAEEERKQAEREAKEKADAQRKAEADAARLKAQALVDAETESEREAQRLEAAKREAAEAAKREAVKPPAARRGSGPVDGTWEQPESKVLGKYVKRTLNILTKDKKIDGEVYEEVWFPAPSSWIDRSCGGNDTFRMVTTARVSGTLEGGNLVLWRDAPRLLTCTCSSRCTVETRRRGMDLAIGAGGAELSDSTGVFVRPGTVVIGGKVASTAEVAAAQAAPVDFRGNWETASFKQRDRSVVQRLEISVSADGKVTGTLVERSSQALPLASWADRFCGGATKWDWVTQWQVEGKVKGRKADIKASNGQSLLCTCPSKCTPPKEKLSFDLEMGATGRTVEYEGIVFERR